MTSVFSAEGKNVPCTVIEAGFCGPDFVLYSEFDSREALNGYADHPLHVEAKSHFFPWVASRMPADYEV